MHLERLTVILEIVGQKGEATVAEICSHSDLPRPTAYRLVNDLTDAGLLDSIEKGKFKIGYRLKQITEADQSDQILLETIAPVLGDAANTHGAAFFLSRLRGRAVEIVAVETPDTGVSFLHPGLGKRPLHACSCSKAIAAFSPTVANTITGQLKAYTEFTHTDPTQVAAEFELIRRRGYAECIEEIERGICSVAVPLGPSWRAPTMSIGATGSVRVFTPSFRKKVGRELMNMAIDLSDRMTWEDPELMRTPA
ncbi:MAG: helix-turn-helix domain-containing protein [Acidimicrobiia bacterium]|nr:helix-turn-helix domain-containing protein [Acidimicrobiia bacterium]